MRDYRALHNTRQCEEKLLRSSIAGIKEMIDLQMVGKVKWVPAAEMLADCMTKRGIKADWLLKVASSNKLVN